MNLRNRRFMREGAILTFSILACASVVFAKAGAPMPKPGYSMIEATGIAQGFFYSNFPDGERAAENDGLHIKDFILIRAVYTNRFEDKEFLEYAWVLTFVHPIQNDHSFTFKVTNDGKVSFLSGTE